MKSAGYVVLFTIAGCSQGVCRSVGSALSPAPSPAASAVGTVEVPTVVEVQAADGGERETLDEQIAPLRKGGRHLIAEPPNDAEEAAYVTWIAAAGVAAQSRQPPPAAPPGFALRVVPGRDLWLLSEDDSRRRGAAAVVLRTGAAAPLIVEAPHTFFDQGTLPIALAIFEAQRARALIVNTSHRYGGGPKPSNAIGDDEGEGTGGASADEAAAETQATGDGARTAGSGRAGSGATGVGGSGGVQGAGGGARGDIVAARERPAVTLAFADVAHAERSFFLSAHRALLQSFPGMPTVQLHGFQDSSAPDAAAIASAVGHGANLERLLAPLRAVVSDGKVLAYPADINKLGGATNVQARWSRQMGAPFYHLELSRALRDKLLTDEDLRRRFAAAFAGLAAGKGQEETRPGLSP
ncbi:hypothetical protein [Sorangium cellulosum]|uniref:hypothetical protein n=1 Tax=Sorangium cellulosum TaxID=56 RepID=UPI000677BEFE|nr:hypothetical protein [Sorangium cellulosum]